MKFLPEIKLDFSDILILPKKSNIYSRKLVNLQRQFNWKWSTSTWSGIPLVSSNMDCITSLDTHKILGSRGWLSLYPKFYNEILLKDDLYYQLHDVDTYGLSCGINKNDILKTSLLIDKMLEKNIHLKWLCIDIANGYLSGITTTIEYFRKIYPHLIIIAGNVVDDKGCTDIISSGADIVKLGIGSGSVCSTRKIAGVGYPQLSAILSCQEKVKSMGAHIMSDGGIIDICDCGKALAAGADMVMLGNLLSGHEESPGEVIWDSHKEYKIYYGMSSTMANNKYNGGLKEYRASEGIMTKIPLKGSLNDTLISIEGGLRSLSTYIGIDNIEKIYDNSVFVRVNNSHNKSLEKYIS